MACRSQYVYTIAFTSALFQVTYKIRSAQALPSRVYIFPPLLVMGAATASNLLHGRFILGIDAGSSLRKNSAAINTELARFCETLPLVSLILSGIKISFQVCSKM